jgi:hydroxymethylpyrimidine pyrophosphatase-like HAD family hydrolase
MPSTAQSFTFPDTFTLSKRYALSCKFKVIQSKSDGVLTFLFHLLLLHTYDAVGDGMNDLQLVANAGVGVATANAVPAVKKAAAWTCPLTNHEGAVASAFERFVL